MPELRVKSRGVINFRLVRGRWTYLECNESMFFLEILTLSPFMTMLRSANNPFDDVHLLPYLSKRREPLREETPCVVFNTGLNI